MSGNNSALGFVNNTDVTFDLTGLWSVALPWLILVLVLVVLWVLLLLLRRYIQNNNVLPAEWQPVVLQLRVPKTIGKERPEDTVQATQEMISKAENLFATLGGLKSQRGLKSWFFGRTDFFAFETVIQNGIIKFYVAVPQTNQQFLEEQLQSVYPHIQIEQVEDYNIFSPTGQAAAAVVKLRRENIFPIKTYKKMENDPLEVFTGSLSELNEDEGAAIQLVIHSAKPSWHDRGSKVASAMSQGKKLKEALHSGGFGNNLLSKIVNDVVDSIFGKSENKITDEDNKPHQMSQLEQDMVKGIEEKTAKAGFDVNIRVITAAQTENIANSRLQNVINAFSEFNIYQYGNSFKVITKQKLKAKQKLIHNYIYRNFVKKNRILLNSEEMVSLWHMPLPITQTPNIEWLKARQAPPPSGLPKEGIVLGVSDYRSIKKEVRIKRDDRRRHVYVIGQTGTGKSTLMKNMMIQDIRNGEGCCVIDPHGDFALDVLGSVPENRAEDVIYFNPADTERPLSINMLEYNSPEQKTFVVNELLGIFDKLYDLKATGGPMFEQYMRNALLLVMEDPESGMTLMEVPKVLADENFRRYKLERCKNLPVKEFWENEAQKAGGEAALANMVPYITSKLTPFIANDIMRPIIAQQKSSLNFRDVMDNKKILLVNLSKGKLGDINSSLLGMIVVGKILLASLGRVDMPEDQRKDFYLYIDEFQNFTTDSIAIILSEARKYKLNLTIAHQYLGQLVKNNDTAIKDAVFGNVGTTIAYRVGVDDAEVFAKQFAPVFDEYDVINIPKFTAYIKLLIDNTNPPAFNIAIPPAPKGSEELKKKIIELSRTKHGRPREEIEADISKRAQLSKVKPSDKFSE